MSAEEPLCRLVEYSINQLRDAIVRGETSCGRATALRRYYFSLTHNLPVTCRSILQEAKAYTSFEYILFYERVRLGIVSDHFFLDCVPSRVTLFVGPTSISLSQKDLQKLKLRDVVADRLQTVGKLESMEPNLPRKIELTTTHTAGLEDEVPGPARFLVARTRAILRGLRTTKRAESFEQCANCSCNRLFYKGELSETWSSAQTIEVNDAEEELCSDGYWSQIGRSLIDPIPDTRRFCSRACRDQHSMHLQKMMPDFGLNMDADDCAKKMGRARIQEAFKLCLKRNEVAARALRTMRSKSWPNLAVHPSEIEDNRQRHITLMNIDLGLLYAASVISESGNLSNGKILPGQRLYWRDNPACFAKPLGVVMKAYGRMTRKQGIISSMLTMSKFLEYLQTNAHKMF